MNRIKPLQDELTGLKAQISKLEENKRRYLGLYELDRIERDLFADRLNDLNRDLDTELHHKSKLELELRDDQAEPISYELVRSLIERLDHLLQQAPFPQRKTLLHLVVKKITLDDKRQVQDVELIFNEETEKHFLTIVPSANQWRKGLFLCPEKPHGSNISSLLLSDMVSANSRISNKIYSFSIEQSDIGETRTMSTYDQLDKNSDYEVEVKRLREQGLKQKEIALRLGISQFGFKTTKGVITCHFCRVKNSLRTVFKYSKFRPIYDTVQLNGSIGEKFSSVLNCRPSFAQSLRYDQPFIITHRRPPK